MSSVISRIAIRTYSKRTNVHLLSFLNQFKLRSICCWSSIVNGESLSGCPSDFYYSFGQHGRLNSPAHAIVNALIFVSPLRSYVCIIEGQLQVMPLPKHSRCLFSWAFFFHFCNDWILEFELSLPRARSLSPIITCFIPNLSLCRATVFLIIGPFYIVR